MATLGAGVVDQSSMAKQLPAPPDNDDEYDDGYDDDDDYDDKDRPLSWENGDDDSYEIYQPNTGDRKRSSNQYDPFDNDWDWEAELMTPLAYVYLEGSPDAPIFNVIATFRHWDMVELAFTTTRKLNEERKLKDFNIGKLVSMQNALRFVYKKLKPDNPDTDDPIVAAELAANGMTANATDEYEDNNVGDMLDHYLYDYDDLLGPSLTLSRSQSMFIERRNISILDPQQARGYSSDSDADTRIKRSSKKLVRIKRQMWYQPQQRPPPRPHTVIPTTTAAVPVIDVERPRSPLIKPLPSTFVIPARTSSSHAIANYGRGNTPPLSPAGRRSEGDGSKRPESDSIVALRDGNLKSPNLSASSLLEARTTVFGSVTKKLSELTTGLLRKPSNSSLDLAFAQGLGVVSAAGTAGNGVGEKTGAVGTGAQSSNSSLVLSQSLSATSLSSSFFNLPVNSFLLRKPSNGLKNLLPSGDPSSASVSSSPSSSPTLVFSTNNLYPAQPTTNREQEMARREAIKQQLLLSSLMMEARKDGANIGNAVSRRRARPTTIGVASSSPSSRPPSSVGSSSSNSRMSVYEFVESIRPAAFDFVTPPADDAGVDVEISTVNEMKRKSTESRHNRKSRLSVYTSVKIEKIEKVEDVSNDISGGESGERQRKSIPMHRRTVSGGNASSEGSANGGGGGGSGERRKKKESVSILRRSDSLGIVKEENVPPVPSLPQSINQRTPSVSIPERKTSRPAFTSIGSDGEGQTLSSPTTIDGRVPMRRESMVRRIDVNLTPASMNSRPVQSILRAPTAESNGFSRSPSLSPNRASLRGNSPARPGVSISGANLTIPTTLAQTRKYAPIVNVSSNNSVAAPEARVAIPARSSSKSEDFGTAAFFCFCGGIQQMEALWRGTVWHRRRIAVTANVRLRAYSQSTNFNASINSSKIKGNRSSNSKRGISANTKLESLIKNPSDTLRTKGNAALWVAAALRNEPGSALTASGALAVTSGARTGRSPADKRIVVSANSSITENSNSNSNPSVDWGRVNIPLSAAAYASQRSRALRFLADAPSRCNQSLSVVFSMLDF
ncbi:hypothetical protein HK100_003474 [Physocladia obscura]|uniref:Phosphoenolpyruvate carboxykinase (ATP) n=1 Tax=Physocladia obscura TaxID=109957 RepID=A0AAD5T8E0_9FUNG|nr:hypothetical protein HK100_003474 [Physocladia obscura]